ncbi:MAG: hypothetical protein NTY22_00750 [Proteobacteria bacterium]|nr:hypothetical protein [Pseudomonadota bacterium]
MMQLFLFLILLLPNAAEAKFSVEDSISLTGGFDSNPLYRDESLGFDYLVKVYPKLAFIYDTKEITLKVGGWADYDKYFKNTNQSSLGWNTAGELEARPYESTRIDFYADYTKNSDPILLDTESRYRWGSPTLKLVMDYRAPLSAWGFSSGFEATSKAYELASVQNFDNRKKYISMGGKYYFFPETALIFGIKSGYSTYTQGRNAQPYGNTNSVYNEIYTGLNGKISSDIMMKLKFGFLWLDYQFGTDFNEPVVTLNITDIISSIHSIKVEYERMAYDSTYSNFYVDNKLSVESKSVWFDSITNLFTAQYIYRYYRAYPRRIDHRLGFITEFAVPLVTISKMGNENISFITTVLAEWVNSDAYNNFGLYTGPDPSASYKRFVVLMGLTTKY